MEKRIIIYTKDQMYAYNFRNKLLKIGWNLEYLCDLHNLMKYLNENHSSVVLLDVSESGLLENLKANIDIFKSSNVIVYLDEANQFHDNFDSNIMVSNISNFFDKLAEIEYRLNKISSQSSQEKLFNDVTDALAYFAISPKSFGYIYLKECIMIGLNMDRKFICYKTEVYPIVAKNYNISISAVEKTIRQALSKAYDKCPEVYNTEYFKFGHATNNEFMNYVIERIIKINKII